MARNVREISRPRFAGGSAAILLMGAGALLSGSQVFRRALGDSVENYPDSLVYPLALGAAGAVLWFLPWDRWPTAASLFVPLVGLLALPTVDYISDYRYISDPEFTYPALIFLTLAWVGFSHPQRSVVVFSPFAAVSLWLMLQNADNNVERDINALAGVALMVPMATFVGEVLAFSSEALRRQQDEERRKAETFERLSAAVAQMRAGTTSARAANMLADLACQSFSCDDVLAVVRRSDGTLVSAVRGNSHLVADVDLPDVMGVAEADSSVRETPIDPTDPDGQALLTVPLMGPTGLLGVVRACLLKAPDFFLMDTARRYSGVASHALVQRATVEASAEDARRDALTGLGNRRMAQDLISSLRPGDALVMIDLDHFKSINDTEGHSAGDEVLRSLGRFLREEVRGSDAVARYGGEEFIFVARDSKGGALHAAQRLVERWRATSPRTTFSAGVATRTDGESPQETLDRADSALYRAKAGGRDRAQESI